ncbi:hypothetical protein KFK09_020003 [Dendrobium nobile]|uniref:Uncharacterized protein n=1 Tax=Dendrobium nobile TaxID=94219 RepID=A0A8T3ATS8_DENNO|nr:hypothetical protein KFK09_020003 [Dendrobium nobile]
MHSSSQFLSIGFNNSMEGYNTNITEDVTPILITTPVERSVERGGYYTICICLSNLLLL